MSTTNDTKVGTAHAAIRLRTPTVRPIDGHPGNYVVDFGTWDMHITPDGWRQINTAVEEGFAANQVDVIGEYVRAFRGER